MDGGGDNTMTFKLKRPWEGTEKKVLKAVHKIKGVRSAEIDNNGYVHIQGRAVHPFVVMQKLIKLATESPELPDHNGKPKKKLGFLSSLFRRKKKTAPAPATMALGGDNGGTRKGRLWCQAIDLQFTRC